MDSTNVVVLDRGNNTTCTINLDGITVVSWRVNNEEQLFVSREAVYDGSKLIRGGISFVFPQLPIEQLGFSKVVSWQIDKSSQNLPNGDVEAIFSLSESEYTRSMWSFDLRVIYRLVLCEKELHFNTTINNPSKKLTFTFNTLLYTYFKVPDVRRCKITGLRGCTFIDNTRNMAINREDRDAVLIREWTDRLYMNTPDQHIITNVVSGKSMRIEKRNFPDTIVWNPWNHAAEIRDLGNNEYSDMMCVEAGHVLAPVILRPDTTFEASLILTLV